MSVKNTHRNLAAALGAALAGSVMLAGQAQALDNPFSVKQLDSGYLQLAAKEGNCGESAKVKEGNCGESTKVKEGNCGEDKSKAKEGNCGGDKAAPPVTKVKEGNCGEAKCGANKK